MANNSHLAQIFRIVVVAITGLLLLFIQHFLLYNLIEGQTIVLCPERPDTCRSDIFIQFGYDPSAIIIYIISLISSLLWYFKALNLAKYFSPTSDTLKARFTWGMLLLFPLLTIILIVFFNSYIKQSALFFVLGFLIFNVVWIYWQITAIVTPLIVSFPVIPFSNILRKLWRVRN